MTPNGVIFFSCLSLHVHAVTAAFKLGAMNSPKQVWLLYEIDSCIAFPPATSDSSGMPS